MDPTTQQLIEAARAVRGEFRLRHKFTAGAVGAALLTTGGKVYTGICIDLGCGLGFCAEAAAVAEMLKHRETRIVKLVAMFANGTMGAPCGRCREMIAQIDARNLDCVVILGKKRVTTIRKLFPEHWLDKKKSRR